MTRISFNVPPGLISDDTTYITPGRWADGDKVRFWRGRPEAIGGWTGISGATVTGVCRNILPWTDNDGAINIAFGTHSNLYVFIGGALYDITPSGYIAGTIDAAPGPGYGAGPWNAETYGTPRTLGGPRTWALSNYGESLVANPSGDTIYQWSNNTGADAVALSNAPDRVTYALVTPERQLLAFGCNEAVSGTFNPLCIRGSDIEDINEWTISSANNAFENVLEGGGRIVAARLLGAFVMVWTDNALYQGQFLGLPEQTYRFDRVAENCGLIGANAVAIVGQTAFWVSPDLQFRQYTPGVQPSILACPIRNDFKDNLDYGQREKIHATTLATYGEVWWHYPDSRDGNENSRFVAVSTLDGSWFRGSMGRTAASDSGVVGFPVMVDPAGVAYYHEVGFTANGAALNWYLESADQYLGAGQENLFIRGVWPDFETQGSAVQLTIKVRQHPQSTVLERGPYSLTPGMPKKDFRATGRLAATKFAGTSGGTRLGQPAFDVVTAGER